MENSLSTMSLDTLVNKLIDLSVSFGSKLLVALLVFFIGRWIVKKLNRLVINILTKRHVEASLATFTKSLVRYRDKLIHRFICFCRCRCRYGIERYTAKFCRWSDDTAFQTV